MNVLTHSSCFGPGQAAIVKFARTGKGNVSSLVNHVPGRNCAPIEGTSIMASEFFFAITKRAGFVVAAAVMCLVKKSEPNESSRRPTPTNWCVEVLLFAVLPDDPRNPAMRLRENGIG